MWKRLAKQYCNGTQLEISSARMIKRENQSTFLSSLKHSIALSVEITLMMIQEMHDL